MSCSPCMRDWVDIAKNTVETLAVLIGGIYAVIKIRAGESIVNLSLSVACDRVGHDDKLDTLSVVILLEKGDRSTIQIHDIQVRVNGQSVNWKGTEWREQMHRLYTPDEPNAGATAPYFDLTWGKRSDRAPFLNLSPGEKTELANYCEVNHREVCHVEVAAVGVELKSGKRSQWRASAVSLPRYSESTSNAHSVSHDRTSH
jgi:hypothetical protein